MELVWAEKAIISGRLLAGEAEAELVELFVIQVPLLLLVTGHVFPQIGHLCFAILHSFQYIQLFQKWASTLPIFGGNYLPSA